MSSFFYVHAEIDVYAICLMMPCYAAPCPPCRRHEGVDRLRHPQHAIADRIFATAPRPAPTAMYHVRRHAMYMPAWSPNVRKIEKIKDIYRITISCCNMSYCLFRCRSDIRSSISTDRPPRAGASSSSSYKRCHAVRCCTRQQKIFNVRAARQLPPR